MKKTYMTGVAASAMLSAAFLLAGCEQQNEFYSDKLSYVRGGDTGTVILSKTVEGHDAFQETLTRELTVRFDGAATPKDNGVCVSHVYRVEGDVAFDHLSPLATEYLQSAPDGLKASVARQFRDAENKGIIPDEKLIWKVDLECGKAIAGDFSSELKNIIQLRETAHKSRFGF